MTKSWKRLLGEELVAWGKSGAIVAKESAETCVNEIGAVSGHRGRKFEVPTTIALVELRKNSTRKR